MLHNAVVEFIKPDCKNWKAWREANTVNGSVSQSISEQKRCLCLKRTVVQLRAVCSLCLMIIFKANNFTTIIFQRQYLWIFIVLCDFLCLMWYWTEYVWALACWLDETRDQRTSSWDSGKLWRTNWLTLFGQENIEIFLDKFIIVRSIKIPENVEKCGPVFPKAQDDVLKYLVFSYNLNITVAALIFFFIWISEWMSDGADLQSSWQCVGAVCVVLYLYFCNKGNIRDVRCCCRTILCKCFCQVHRIRTCFKHRLAHSASAADWHLVVRGSHYSRDPDL